MTDRPPRQGRSFWAQTFAILALAARQKRNQFSRIRSSPKGLRSATAHKNDRKVFMPLFFGVMMLGLSFNTCYQAVHGLAGYAEGHWPAALGPEVAVIEVGAMEHALLEMLSEHPGVPPEIKEKEVYKASFRRSSIKSLADHIQRDRGIEEAAAQTEAERLAAHRDKHGMNGFVRKGRGSPYKSVDFAGLSDQASTWLGRVFAIIFTCLVVGVTLMPMSTRAKDLGALDAHLAWLYCLPLNGREILSGRFLSMTFVRPMAWIILLPFCGTLFWAMGYGVFGLLLALGVTLALAVVATGIELATETWLRTGASFRLKKNVQAAATIVGTLAFFTGMSAGFAGGRSAGWVDWILDHTPATLTMGLGHLIMLPLQGIGGLVQLGLGLAVLVAACGIGGWVFAAQALNRGLASGNEREGARTATASRAQNRSLARFEWLLLMRDRNLAIVVLVMPLMLVGYQLLINPGLVAVANARNLATIGFGCGVWAATMTAPHVVASETHSMWVVFSLPVEIAGYFRRRTRVWRTTGVVMTAAIILGLALWKGGVPAEDWWRIPAAVIGVWVVSLVVYSLMMGGARLPDPTGGEQPRISILRMYACMLIGGMVGALIWGGGPWQILAGLVIWWFFGFSLWQGVVRKLRYLLEPTMATPSRLTMSSALIAVLIFFAVQVTFSFTGLLLLSYSVAGVVASIYCAISLSNHSLPKHPRTEFRLLAALPLATVACVACGAAWMTVLHQVSPFRELYESTQANAAFVIDLHSWQIVVLLVVAAPLIEEFLFRGYVLRIMQGTWSPRTAIFANALLFAVVHPGLSFPPVFLLGLATAWLYTRSQRLWPGMLLHAAYNAAVVAIS